MATSQPPEDDVSETSTPSGDDVRVGSELTPKQEKILKQFRDNVKDIILPEHDDHYLSRWLYARNWNLKKSEDMLRTDLQWRKDYGTDTILNDCKIPEVIDNYLPGILFGEDKQGNPIYIDAMGRADIKGLCYAAKKSDLIKQRVYHLEHIYQVVFKEQSAKHGRRVHQVTQIMDVKGFGKRHLWRPGAELYIEIIKLLEAHYPETLARSFIINAPRVFIWAFNFVKPFMSEDTVEKIQFLGADWKEQLLKYIDADQLPACYGGTRTGPDGDEWCSDQVGN